MNYPPINDHEQVGVFKRNIVDRLMSMARYLGVMFWLTVLIPTTISIFYFGFIASDVYISESRFVVRSPEKPATSGLGGLLKSAGFSNAGDELYTAQDYVVSRDALRALNQGEAFRKAYDEPSISFLNRFDTWLTGGTFEDLYDYYGKRVSLVHDSASSITKLTVRAYTPKDARQFNEQLLEMAEATVNRLNVRGRQDLIRFAEREVAEAKGKAEEAALALSAFRNREGVVDPDLQASVQLQMISKLQDELITTRMQLLQIRSYTPKNPQIEALETKVSGLSREMEKQIGQLTGGRKSLSSAVVRFQRLTLENQFADRQLGIAMTSLEEAKNEARRKQAYVERVVQPNLPDRPQEPRRATGMLLTFALGLVAWGILSMLLSGVMEHRD